MKKIVKIIAVFTAILLLASICTVSFFAETVYEHDGVWYTKINDDFVSVYGYNAELNDLVIPDRVDEGYVLEIGHFAMQNNTSITSLDLSHASHLNSLGQMCFNGCSSLGGNLYIPYLITDVRMGAFQGCSSLESVAFSARTSSIPEVCFNRCSSLTTVTISDSVSSIGKQAFANCPNLTEVYIPSTVTDIHYTAFNNDDALVIYCYTGSYAQRFALERGYNYVLLDAPKPTEPPTEPQTEPETDVPTEEPTVPETVEPTQPVTEPKGYYLGDVDGDNIVSTVDVTQIQRLLAKLVHDESCVFEHGDVDGDGGTTVMDATLIQRFLGNLFVQYDINKFITE